MVFKKKKKLEEEPPEIPGSEPEVIDMPEEDTEKVDELNQKIEFLQKQIKEMKEEREKEDEEEVEEAPEIKPKVKKTEQKIVRVPVYLSTSDMMRGIYEGIQVLLRRGEYDQVEVSD